ncbi:hypothetical protein D3C84_271640 [compost metagenome]
MLLHGGPGDWGIADQQCAGGTAERVTGGCHYPGGSQGADLHRYQRAGRAAEPGRTQTAGSVGLHRRSRAGQDPTRPTRPGDTAAHVAAGHAEAIRRRQQSPRRVGQAPAWHAAGDFHRRWLRRPRHTGEEAAQAAFQHQRRGRLPGTVADSRGPRCDLAHRPPDPAPVAGARRLPDQRRQAVHHRQQDHRLAGKGQCRGDPAQARGIPPVRTVLGRHRDLRSQQLLRQPRLQQQQVLRHVPLAAHAEYQQAPAPRRAHRLADRLGVRRPVVRLLLLRSQGCGAQGQYLPRQPGLRNRPARPLAGAGHRQQHRERDPREARHHHFPRGRPQLDLQQPDP